MATIVLSAAGAAIGGPIGAAVGAVIGQQVDNAIFAPKPRQGPRLGDLTLQTSSYGSAIPKLFGAVRVAGTVIWGTDLVERQSSQSGGKGRGSTTAYSYSASFAVALSGRPVGAIGRIWADGKLLRGAAGDFKFETGFRFYNGSEDQTVDPLIGAAEGIATTPAYRGVAYAVFESMALGPFGNRIPSLSFEILAESGPVLLSSVVGELSGLPCDQGPAVDGIVVTGDSVGSAMSALAELAPFSLVIDPQQQLGVRYAAAPATSADERDLGAHVDKKTSAVSTQRLAATTLPEVLTVGYNSRERDYLIGAQRARRDSAGRREARVDLPVTLSAAAAKGFAEARLSRIWTERSRAVVTVPWRMLKLGAGGAVTIPGLGGTWRIARMTFEAMALRLDLRLIDRAVVMLPASDPGQHQSQLDVPHGPTVLRVVDLPQLRDEPVSAPVVGVVANGSSSGWRRAALFASLDAGASWVEVGETAAPATMGVSLSTLEPGAFSVADQKNSVDVRLVNAGLHLGSADEMALRGGANLAALGDEIIQFGSAEPLGGSDWRLSGLRRGLRATEAAVVAHPAGSSFTLIEEGRLKVLDARFAVTGLKVMAVGVADSSGVIADGPARVGRAVLPLSPVRIDAVAAGADVQVSWTRRSRDGWLWRDGIDVPLAEQSERYSVRKTVAGRTELNETVVTSTWIYSAAELAADRAAGASEAIIEIRQIGTFGFSSPSSLTVQI